jgi:hypothetical protein
LSVAVGSATDWHAVRKSRPTTKGSHEKVPSLKG